MSYRFVKITTYYRDFLKEYYDSNPDIVKCSYNEQLEHLMGQGYAWSDYFAIHLNKLGVDAYEIVCNAKPLQQTWAAENGSSAAGLDVVIDQLAYLKPDVVFFQESFKFDAEWLARLKEKAPSIKLTIGFCCTGFNELYLNRFKIFDFVVVCSPHFEKAFKEFGLNVYTIVHAFEVSILDKIKINNNYPESDFIFLGSFIPGPAIHDVRQMVVEHLLESNINIELYSNILTIAPLDLFFRQNAYIVANILKKLKLSSIALTLPGVKKAFYLDEMPKNSKNINQIKKSSKPAIYGFEMFKALSRSKIGFNFHGQVAGDYAANMRLFEVTGVGSCLITDWKKNLNDLFEIDKEVVAFKTAEECVDKVKWLLNNPLEREKIAKAGQQRVLKSHTIEMRVNQLDEIIRKELKKEELHSMILNRLKKLWNGTFHKVNWYNLRSTKPVSKVFGLDRGNPIDRYYIENFLEKNKSFVKGKALEIAENTYSKIYNSGVTSFEILHVDDSNKKATIIGDLTKKETLPENEIDCFICTQTLNFIADFHDAIKGMHYLLKPGGIALVTLAGISQISRYDMNRWGDYWRFTTLSAQKIFSDVFGAENVKIDFYGNVLAAVSFLEGLAVHELTKEELDFKDEDYQMLITVIAKKV